MFYIFPFRLATLTLYIRYPALYLTFELTNNCVPQISGFICFLRTGHINNVDKLFRRFTYLYFTHLSTTIHSTGHINCVPPDIILRFPSTNYSGSYSTMIQTWKQRLFGWAWHIKWTNELQIQWHLSNLNLHRINFSVIQDFSLSKFHCNLTLKITNGSINLCGTSLFLKNRNRFR